MKSNGNIPGTDEAWDSRQLGSEANYAAVDQAVNDVAIDAALDLQPISIRLQKSLTEDFKLIAALHGMGYQTLMRQVLTRFADCEKKRVLREYASETARERQEIAEGKESGKRRA